MEQTFIRIREQILHATHRHIPLTIRGSGNVRSLSAPAQAMRSAPPL